MQPKSPKTKISNEPAIWQIESADGRRLFSIVKAAGGFRFIEETELYEPESAAVPAYWYWTETHRSGLYETLEAAENEAVCILPWLKAQISH